ncbi:DUF418 domain-containing protein [Cytobacillus horneckiae]|uniref:DUF418 domain-containing protein n=1 Tax=Cytobacillus horneckiae TaxID=549687 RepID=UPI0034CD3F8F
MQSNLNRIDLLDILRGFALVGLPFVNILMFWGDRMNLSGTEPDIWIQRGLYLFVEGRFYAIFSFLFGVGFWIFLSRAEAKNDRPYRLFIRRMIILLVAGLLHQIINPGEALAIYAVFGLFVLIFYKAPKQFNLIVGVVGIIIGSIFGAKILLPLPLIILGIAFGQYRVFETYKAHKKMWAIIAVVSLLATAALSILLWNIAPNIGFHPYREGYELTNIQFEANQSFFYFADLAMIVAPVFSVFYISTLVIIEPLIKRMLLPLNHLGRMALTNYIGQSVILYALNVFMPAQMMTSYLMAVISCAAVIIVQAIASSLWLKVFKYGPLEWLWRCGTYGKWLKIK